jgi:triphosphoribosyl-dephospho-CoA synthase
LTVPGRSVIEPLFREACEIDIRAIKPGNVRVGSSAHDVSADDFLRSAAACAPALTAPNTRIGWRILRAIEATRQVVPSNTNLGIVLLAAPLARAAETSDGLRAGVERELACLDREDAVHAYAAIRLANPGGLGESPRHDVRDEPNVTLLEAMREAAPRDSIARQYAEGFRDIFQLGVPAWHAGLTRLGAEERAATFLFLELLAAFPDSHIQRKLGAAAAQSITDRAIELSRCLKTRGWSESLEAELVEWDQALKRDRINPGTSADLTVASILAAKLLEE